MMKNLLVPGINVINLSFPMSIEDRKDVYEAKEWIDIEFFMRNELKYKYILMDLSLPHKTFIKSNNIDLISKCNRYCYKNDIIMIVIVDWLTMNTDDYSPSFIRAVFCWDCSESTDSLITVLKHPNKKCIDLSFSYSLIQKEEPIKKIFISQNMSEKTEEQVMRTRSRIKKKLESIFGEKVEILDNYYHDELPKGSHRLKYLGASIQMIPDADLVFFAKEKNISKGVKIELKICTQYEINFIMEGDNFDDYELF